MIWTQASQCDERGRKVVLSRWGPGRLSVLIGDLGDGSFLALQGAKLGGSEPTNRRKSIGVETAAPRALGLGEIEQPPDPKPLQEG